MKVKLIKKIKKNAPVEKDGDWNESKKHHVLKGWSRRSDN